MTTTYEDGPARWPAHLRPGAVRWARPSSRYEETVAFYRDLVGLPVVDEFRSSFGEDGTVFGLPDTTVQMEVLRARLGGAASAGSEQLVLYLDDAAARDAATAPLRSAGLKPDPLQHAYWEANGAVTYRDPDGRGVVFAPWVHGRDPDPVDREPESADAAVSVDWYDGDRRALRALFEEAEDSPEQLDSYLDDGRVLVARLRDRIVGHLQLVETGREREIELKNMAVDATLRGTGIGRRLVEQAVTTARADGHAELVVATAAADVGNLRFYQRCGFRFAGIEQDAFVPATGYPDDLMIDGIPLRDRIRLTQRL